MSSGSTVKGVEIEGSEGSKGSKVEGRETDCDSNSSMIFLGFQWIFKIERKRS